MTQVFPGENVFGWLASAIAWTAWVLRVMIGAHVVESLDLGESAWFRSSKRNGETIGQKI